MMVMMVLVKEEDKEEEEKEKKEKEEKEKKEKEEEKEEEKKNFSKPKHLLIFLLKSNFFWEYFLKGLFQLIHIQENFMPVL